MDIKATNIYYRVIFKDYSIDSPLYLRNPHFSQFYISGQQVDEYANVVDPESIMYISRDEVDKVIEYTYDGERLVPEPSPEL